MKNILVFAPVVGALTFWTSGLRAQFSTLAANAIDKPIVVELFTSQSCSSCPAADKNLAALAENPNIIPLSFHVTYWNHLHWEDTLSQQFATDRQRAYARYKKNGRVYTPQMIVNGRDEFVGSRKGNISTSLKNAQSLALIELKISGTTLTATLPQVKKGDYTLWLIGTKDTHTQDIPSGENRGRSVTYKNAVKLYQDAGTWDGSAQDIAIDIEKDTETENYVILAQKQTHGAIIAAGKTP